jgi:hypothetical protein
MVVKLQPAYYRNITASTNSLKNGPVILKGMFVNSTSSGTIKIYDSLTQAGTVVNNTITPAAGAYYPLGDAGLAVGLSVTIGGTLDCTLYFQ